MKKLMMNGKKVLAVLTLMVMVVCAAAPAVNAGNSYSKVAERRPTAELPGWYHSYTQISGHSSNGVRLNMSAGAQYCGEWGFDYNQKTAKAKSPSKSALYEAYHAYGVGGNVDFTTTWRQN